MRKRELCSGRKMVTVAQEDVAKDNNIHSTVASRLVQFAKSERITQGKDISKEPRVAVIAVRTD